MCELSPLLKECQSIPLPPSSICYTYSIFILISYITSQDIEANLPLTGSNLARFADTFLRNHGGVERNRFSLPNPVFGPDESSQFYTGARCFYYDIDMLLSEFSNEDFSVYSLNVQSIRAKIDQINIFLQFLSAKGFYFDVLCFQETWLQDAACDRALIQIDGYSIFLQGKSCSGHGGLAIYIRDCYSFTPMVSISKSKVWEGCFVKISSEEMKKELVIGNIYRPPNNLRSDVETFIQEFSEVLQSINGSTNDIIMAGDFNIDLLKLNTDNPSLDFFNLCASQGFSPEITLPTRLTDTSATIIDNYFCRLSTRSYKRNAGVLTNHISDHQGYFLTFDNIHKTKSKNNSKYIEIIERPRNFYDRVKNDLVSKNFADILSPDNDPNRNYEILENEIVSAIDRHSCIKRVRFNKHRHKKNPWITRGIIRSIRHRDKLYKEIKQTEINGANYDTLKVNLSSYNRLLKKLIRQAKANYYQNSFTQVKNDHKETWKLINKILYRGSKAESLPEYMNVSGTQINSQQEIVDALNEHFATIGVKLSDQIGSPNESYTNYLTENIPHRFTFQSVDTNDVKQAIKDLLPKVSTGRDGISTKMLKQIRNEISEPLKIVINQTFQTGIFPAQLKTARVKALFKKGNTHDPNNYRPISLLPAISKVFEKIMLKQLRNYFTLHSLLFKSQYGFRNRHSTELATLELLDRVITAMDENKIPFNIFIDLSKAFDCLNHRILLHKLHYYGIRDTSLLLLQNYLSERTQFVAHDNIKSNIAEITTGVPQGSILGPFLFLVYMNDFSKSSNKLNMINYADDTTLISTVNSFISSEEITEELDKINRWIRANKLTINVGKTKAMFFHTKHKRINRPDIYLNDALIETVDEFNYLGILLDKHLSWKPQQIAVTKKISQVTGILAKLKNFLPIHILKTIYTSLIASHLNYCILAWGAETAMVAKAQKKAIRIISNAKINAHTEPLFKKHNLLKAEDICKLQELKFFFRLMNNSLPHYFQHNYIFFHADAHNYPTRSRHAITLPRFRHEFFRYNLRYRITQTVNNAPDLIIGKTNTHSFQGYSTYAKNWILSTYSNTCSINNCYICNRTYA